MDCAHLYLRSVVDVDDTIPEITLVLVNLYARITSRRLDETSRRCPQPGLCIYFRKASQPPIAKMLRERYLLLR